jgi:hypothetical protein
VAESVDDRMDGFWFLKVNCMVDQAAITTRPMIRLVKGKSSQRYLSNCPNGCDRCTLDSLDVSWGTLSVSSSALM